MYHIRNAMSVSCITGNFFRLENEHSNNCGQFRAVKEIPLPFVVDRPGTSPETPDNDPPTPSTPVGLHMLDTQAMMEALSKEETQLYNNREYDTKDGYASRRESRVAVPRNRPRHARQISEIGHYDSPV
jgi:hypothetical protein